MAEIIDTSLMQPGQYTGLANKSVYCGLDTCVTREVFDVTKEQHTPDTQLIYDFERASQAPALEMMLRGIKIDNYERFRLLRFYEKQLDRLEDILYMYLQAMGWFPISPKFARSHVQLKKFFYEFLGLPEQYKYDKGQRKVTCNRDALEALQAYRYARPVISAILKSRDLGGYINVLRSGVDSDGRMRFGFNVAGTETGRWSSNENAFGSGTTGHNITDLMRRIFIADEGYKLGYADLEQAESRVVAYVSGDKAYIEACESDDLHTQVAKVIWPEVNWTGDSEEDREKAELLFYRHWNRRDLSKRGGHLCLTEDHEVLTPSGWIRISDKPDIIMTWKETKEGRYISEFAPVSHWTDEIFNGSLCEFEGNSISILMTPNHRVPYKADVRTEGVSVRRAEDGPGRFMPLGSGFVGGTEEVDAKLIAAFMADGYQNKNQAEWHLKKHRKIERLYELAAEYGHVVNATKRDKYKIHTKDFPKKPGAFMLNWTKKCLLDFVEEYKYWDGWIGPTSVTLSCKDKIQLEWMQTFGRILGIGGNIGYHVELKGKHYWRLQQNNRLWASGSSVKFRRLPDNETRVLCPTVPSEFFYVRRNGKISATGNTNYYGQAASNAKKLHVTIDTMKKFQFGYFKEYKGIPIWHTSTATTLQTKGVMTTHLGRRRYFMGRRYDDATLREAIAHEPQSIVGDLLNLGMYRVWKYSIINYLLSQLHDAILAQFKEEDEEEAITELKEMLTIPVQINGREMVIPVAVPVGWNWAKYDYKKPERNPDGLKLCPGGDDRTRQVSPSTPLMKRIIS